VTTLLGVETQLINAVTQQVTSVTPSDLAAVTQEVMGLATVENQLATDMTMIAGQGVAATDPTFQQNLATLVANEGLLTNLLNDLTPMGVQV
jgi:hypothetical protein